MLKDVKVIDCTERLGWLAGRLLADMGAEVIKIEAPASDVSSPEWRALNVNKRLLRLDVAAQPAEFNGLLAKVDILLATPRAASEDAEPFSMERLAPINPQLVVTAITPFGLTGPKARWLASDLELMAAGGAMSLAGEPDGHPLRVSAPQSYAWAGAQAAVGTLTGLAARRRTGRGQLVDVSAQAAVIVALSHAPAFADILGQTPMRAGSYITGRSVTGAKFRVFWPCQDGHINFILYGGAAGRRTNEQLVAWMRERGAALGPLASIDWKKFDPTGATQEDVDAMESAMAVFFLQLSKREFLEGAHRREMLGYPVSTMADIATDPQLEARGFWQDIAGASGVTERHCGAFVVVDGVRPRLAPATGQASPQASLATEV